MNCDNLFVVLAECKNAFPTKEGGNDKVHKKL